MFGKNVAAKLRSLPQEQRIYAEKEINDALFDAEVGALQQISTFNMSNAFFPPTQPNYQQQTSQSQSLPTQFPGFRRARTFYEFQWSEFKIKAGCPLLRRTGTGFGV
ncbi:hypothetical protein J6590_103949 [Homalodisca vitripennis]|nr:hypothetical protein J6590_103949 [Homalodisca vitripennis]